MTMRSPRLAFLVRVALWSAVAVAYVAAIVPGRDAPSLGWTDKVDHMAAFFTISLLAGLAYPRLPALRLLAIVSAFGAFIELSQAMPFIGRDAEWADWAADTVATGVGLLVAWPLRRLVWRRARFR